MSFKIKILKKILGSTLAVLLLINPLAVPLVYAEGEEVTPTPTPQSTITTGDAEASSQTDTTVNNNKDTVDGVINTPTGTCSPPEGQINCPDDIGIGASNQAVVSNGVGSSANTGENEITGTGGDAAITTGDATASGEMTSVINSNTVILETTPTITPTPTVESVPESSASSEPPKTLTVENSNEAAVQNNADVSAKTGENIASENLGDVKLETGDALAWLNMLNLLNTNIVASNFEILFLDIKDGAEGEINLNELWKKLQEQNSSDSIFLVGNSAAGNLRLLVRNTNEADLANKVNVSALSGDNQANGNNNVSMETGNATALANVANVVNTNIVGAKFFFGIINILGQFKGDLILPRPEMFAGDRSSSIGGVEGIFENSNTANVKSNVNSSADTGGNQADNNGGNNLLNTGEAVSSVNTYSLVNLNVFRNDWFYFLLNSLGNYEGRIYGWSAPEAITEGSKETEFFQTGSGSQGEPGQAGMEAAGTPTPMLQFQNQNSAKVENEIAVSASTGGNKANENKSNVMMKTGKATAIANLINLININILGGRWFMGLVNVLGNW